MNHSRSKHPVKNKDNDFKDFTTLVKDEMERKGITRAELKNNSKLSNVTIGRILKNTNNKGYGYTATIETVIAVAHGLKLSEAEAQELLCAAFPQWKVGLAYLGKRNGLDSANEILFDNGFDAIGD